VGDLFLIVVIVVFLFSDKKNF